jgi:hypothetical protein
MTLHAGIAGRSSRLHLPSTLKHDTRDQQIKDLALQEVAMSRILSIVGMIAVLAASFSLDRWIWDLRRLGHSTLRLAPSLWGTAIAMLAAVSMLLALAWYVSTRKQKSRLVGVAFVALGLGLMAFPPLAFSEPSPILAWMDAPALRAVKIALMQTSGVSLFQLTSAAIAIIGVITLLSGARRSTSRLASA